MPEEKNTRLVELRNRLKDLDAKILHLAEKESILTPDEEQRWDDLTVERETILPEYEKLEERAARAAQIRNKTYRQISGLPDAKKPTDEWFGVDVRTMDWRTARDGALRVLEDRDSNHMLNAHQADLLDNRVRSAGYTELARRILVTENEHYRSAFHKKMTRGNDAVLTPEESIAMLRYEEYRAASEGTTTAGGFAIPVFIDPSVILTDQETDNPFLSIARQVDVNTNAWKGVSAAGVSWSFDAEATAVSDDSITIAQPSVTVFTARGFIPYSIEIGEDWPGFQSEMARLLAEGYDELLIDKFSRGSGSGEPRGILTALGAASGSQVVSTTDGAFGQEDIYKTWKSLPQKYRRKASWMMSVDINNRIRQFGAANVYHAATVTLPAGAAEVLFNKPVYESPYFPDFTGTTGVENRCVVGDFSNYVIARRTGMNVELVPQLFDVTNNRPTGQRGWFAYARIGGNSVNDAAFRLLQNQ
ncbi:phage major capsid protein, HK97 family [Amycolatopsis pretoriensis]|uniref:Phage major capsid protein, HK97 family n=3 Tax=Amycolatopsis pretoriensis TaxID=218821 RepID=A0A1H5R7K3_9PSEU|nr:phage major capsid protein [Amycolatopsis pretoriensis]SEF34386.1 phage major capsid protein, HK97 family [Amycolatopsis pretoriensis]